MGISNTSRTTINPLWYEQTAYVKWVFENKEKHISIHEAIGAKISIISILCGLIESVCGHILSDYLKTSHSLEHIKNLDDIQKKVDEAHWIKYDSLWKEILKHNLSFYVKGHKCNIDMLFKLRNSVVHGNAFISREETLNDVRIKTVKKGNYDTVYSFLKKKKIIIEDGNIDLYSYLLFSDKVMQYFLNETISFIEHLKKEELSNEFSIRLIDDWILKNLKAI